MSCVAPGIHVMMETTRKRQYNRMLVINVSTPNVTVARSSGNSIYGSVASQINRGPLDILRLPPRSPPQKKITRLISDSSNLITDSYQVKMAKLHVINTQIKEIVKLKNKLVRQLIPGGVVHGPLKGTKHICNQCFYTGNFWR